MKNGIKNILVIEGRESIGGGQIITKRICDCLSEKYQVSVFIPGEEISPISKLLSGYKKYHFQNHKYNLGRKHLQDYLKFIINFLTITRTLNNAIKSSHADVLYVQHLSLLPIVVFVNFIHRKYIIAHIHVVYIDKKVRWLINFFLKNKYVKKIVGVSSFSLKQLDRANNSKSVVIHNPVQFSSMIVHSSRTYNIAIIGDVCYQKGQHILLQALEFGGQKFTAHIIGNIVDTKYKDYLDYHYSHVKHIYTGMVDNVNRYLEEKRIDITVIASVGLETFSMSMVESWAKGIPTLATDGSGMKELVHEYLSEYEKYMLFKLGDSEELFKKIMYLESDPAIYSSISIKVANVVRDSLNVEIFKNKLFMLLSDL